MKKIFYIFLLTVLYSCETAITPDLNKAEEILVIDAWIDQKMKKQEIRITRSQPYFDNSFPLNIHGASVKIEDINTGTIYNFTEEDNSYFWKPNATPFGNAGHNYKLTVAYGGEIFVAYSRLGRVPLVDSIKYKFNTKDLLIKQDYFTAEFESKDPIGVGDAYWIKAWKNGVYLGKPEELNIAYDAGFTPGQSVDGVEFSIPIRQNFVNPQDKKSKDESEIIPPYQVNDSLYIEIHSLDPQAFEFLYTVYFQIARTGGFAEIFSTPLVNSPTNFKSTNPNSTTNVAGFFNVSAVSSKGQKLTQEIADKASETGKK